MKELYLVIIRLNKFFIYESGDYFNSWWTLFELITFINAKKGNLSQVICNQEIKVDLEKFLLKGHEWFKLQRNLLYSNPSILPEAQLKATPILQAMFPGGKYELTTENIWNKKILQCVRFNEKHGYEDFESFRCGIVIFQNSPQVSQVVVAFL